MPLLNRRFAFSAAASACLLLASPAFVAPRFGNSLPELQLLVGRSDAQPPDGWSPPRSGKPTSVGAFGAVALVLSAAMVAKASFAYKSANQQFHTSSAAFDKSRLCMLASTNLIHPDVADGCHTGLNTPPLRAFETEIGVQAPVGFWDPVGYTADGNVAAYRRRRCVELKHGRVCMMAASGYIHPELSGKWPGYISPTLGLKFQDIPNGLGAISKVPVAGWAQIFALSGVLELAQGFDDYKTGTPGDYGWKTLTSSDPNERRKKLAAEVANGRLAMTSIIGMFFQDGLTGQAWGDWSLYKDSPLR